MTICPLLDCECMDDCSWNVDGECVLTKISYSLYNITMNTKDIAEELKDE